MSTHNIKIKNMFRKLFSSLVLIVYILFVSHFEVHIPWHDIFTSSHVQAATTTTMYAGSVEVLNDWGPNWSNPWDALWDTTNTSAFVGMSQNPTISRTLSLTDFDFESQNIPVWSTINGIQVEVEWRWSHNNVREERIQLTKNRVTWYGDNKSTQSNQTSKWITTYWWLTDLWGTTWSDTEIHTEYFWVLLQYRKTGWGTRYADVYRVGITIDYTPPAIASPLNFEIISHNRWGTGFCYSFEATNVWVYDITNWVIGFNLNGAAMTSSFGTTLTDLWWWVYEYTPNASWNDPFNVWQTISFWFCADGWDGYVSNLNTNSFDVIWWAVLQDFSFSEESLQVDVTTSSSHGAGYCRNIALENTWTEVIEWWSLQFTLNQALTSSFNGVFTVEAGVHTIWPVWFNRIINPGQTYTLWFCTTWTNVDDIWSAKILIWDPGFCGLYYEWTAANPFDPNNLLLRRIDSEIMFNWGTGSPDPVVPDDDFTITWTGSFQAQESWIHTFRVRVDDGVRLYINWDIIIDEWRDQAPTIYTTNINLIDGKIYDIVMEYYEREWWAVAELDWQQPSDSWFISLDDNRVYNTTCIENFPPTDIFLSEEFVFDWNPAGTLVGTLTSEDQTLWGSHTYTLVNGIWDTDNNVFSIVWDELFIDEIADFTNKTNYNIRIRTTDQVWEIFEKAFVIQVIPPWSENPWFCGNYYSWTANNPFEESNIILKRVDNVIDFDWGTWSPDPAIPNDLFTIRWTGYIESDESGLHEFRARTDDGVRVFIDNQNIIDQWQNQAAAFSFWNFNLDAWVRYRIVIEYYEEFWQASAEFEWQKPSESNYSFLDHNNIFHLGACDLSPVDTIPPVINSTFPENNILYPSKNINISLIYSDEIGGSGIDINSINIDIERWNGSSWDNINTFIWNSNITSSSANFDVNLETHGRYRYIFEVSDNAGNTQTIQNEFYIDAPIFNISTAEIDIEDINNLTQNFSSTVTLTVETVGAAFEIIMNRNTDPIYNSQTLESFDGVYGYGFRWSPLSWGIQTIANNQVVASQWVDINTNGERNIYSYEIQLGAIVEVLQAAWDYEGNINFSIHFDY